MKARVKATGEIIDVEYEPCIANDRWDIGIRFTDNDDNIYREYQLDFKDVTQEKSDVKEKSLPKDEPDYWEKLKHQYAGMAMQGILSSDKILGVLGIQKGIELDAMISDMSVKIATTLVNRLKEDKL